MPLPVITDTYQATLVWELPAAPRPATTTLHFFDLSGVANHASLYAFLNANVNAQMWFHTVNTAFVTTVNITKLDGATAGQAFTTGSPAKWGGNSVPDAILQGASVISIKSDTRGPSGRNRIFLPWVSETEQTNGTLVPANTTTQQNAWNTFLAACTAGNWKLVAASGKYSSADLATSVVARPFLKTQRRRSRR